MRIAAHREPAWRDRANYIIRADLEPHGMPGSAEQLRARSTDDGFFEICCIPFFTSGMALGDVVEWDSGSDEVAVVRAGGRRVIRVAFADTAAADAEHVPLHGALVAAGCPVEFRGPGYCAIDAESDASVALALAAIQPFHERHGVSWEWGT